MARGVNKVIVVGNLGQDPETRYIPSGSAVTNLRIATNESWKDKQTGEQKDRTEWHSVAMFGRLAESTCVKDLKYISKENYAHGNGKIKMAMIAIQPRSSPMKCKCSVTELAAVRRL